MILNAYHFTSASNTVFIPIFPSFLKSQEETVMQFLDMMMFEVRYEMNFLARWTIKKITPTSKTQKGRIRDEERIELTSFIEERVDSR